MVSKGTVQDFTVFDAVGCAQFTWMTIYGMSKCHGKMHSTRYRNQAVLHGNGKIVRYGDQLIDNAVNNYGTINPTTQAGDPKLRSVVSVSHRKRCAA